MKYFGYEKIMKLHNNEYWDEKAKEHIIPEDKDTKEDQNKLETEED